MSDPLALPGATLQLVPDWLPRAAADAMLDALLAEIPWEQHHVRLFGRLLPAPRLSCWIGDPGARYSYSAVQFAPRPWTPSLVALRDRLNDEFDGGFNSVLANRYRDGTDGMGWHADDEPELGPRPLIASISLGAARRLVLRQRRGTQRAELQLPHGSLLLMGGDTQQHWLHGIPKTAKPVGERLNLTFRRIVALPARPSRPPAPARRD